MKPEQFREFLKKVLIKMPKRVVIVEGAVGVGKSEVVADTTNELGFELRDIRLSLLDSVDLRGLPDIDREKKETYWTKPIFLPPMDYDKDVVLFFDEFSNADKSVQNACLQLMLDRKLGEYTLPEKTRVICACNRLQDGAWVNKLSSALNNRMIHIEFEPDFDDWKKWAFKHNINPLVIGYHNYTKGANLHNYKNDIDNKAFASPRTWAFLGLPNGVLDLGLENGVSYEAIKGTIGEGVGVDFYGYLKIYRDLPNPDDILLRDKNIIPDESNIMYALCSALINSVRHNKDKLNRLIEYSLKIPKEFSVVLIKDLMKTELKEDLIKCKAFDRWVETNKSVIL